MLATVPFASFDWRYSWLLQSFMKVGQLCNKIQHYDDVIMGAIASQIGSRTTVYSTVYSDADQSKHQSSASLAFVRGIHRRPVNSTHKWPVTRKMFPFDDVIMKAVNCVICIDWLWANVCRVTDYDWHVDRRAITVGLGSWHGGHDDVKTLESFPYHWLIDRRFTDGIF